MNIYDSISSRKLIARDRLSRGVEVDVHSSKFVLSSSTTLSSTGLSTAAGAETDRARTAGRSVRSMTLIHRNSGKANSDNIVI